MGFSNGAVLLLRGALGSPNEKIKPPLALLLPEPYGQSEASPAAGVSCLVFGERKGGVSPRSPRLFAVTHGGRGGRGSGVVVAYDLSESVSIDKSGLEGGALLGQVVLDDEEGGDARCCAHDSVR